jgi:hypothetical protein
MPKIPRNSGNDPDGAAKTELDHFGNCPICGALVDMRDLSQVLAHLHDQQFVIEEGEGHAVDDDAIERPPAKKVGARRIKKARPPRGNRAFPWRPTARACAVP